MIRKTLIGLITLAFLPSCENDLDITAEWKDIPVIYSILNVDDSTHYVKLNKAFLGQGNVMMMAQEFDSIYYNDDNVELRLLEHSSSNGVSNRSITLEPTDVFDKPEGDFSSPAQVIYKTNEILYDNKFYSIELEVSDSVTAKSERAIDLLETPQLIKPNTVTPLNILTDGYAANAEWNSIRGGKLYELVIRFHYIEQQIANLNDTVHKYIDWNFPLKQSINTNGGEDMFITIDPQQFLSFIAANIEPNPNVYRQVLGTETPQSTSGFVISHRCLDFTLNIAGKDLSDYLLLNQSSSSIVTERPEYSNIDVGIGLLSSRSYANVIGVKINNDTNDEISSSDITKHLNFAYFILNGDGEIEARYN
jgi:hypothetical protein